MQGLKPRQRELDRERGGIKRRMDGVSGLRMRQRKLKQRASRLTNAASAQADACRREGTQTGPGIWLRGDKAGSALRCQADGLGGVGP